MKLPHQNHFTTLVELGSLKPTLNKVVNGLIYSNIWVSLALASISYVFMIQAQALNIKLITINLLIGYSGYNYIYWSTYFISSDKLPPNRRIWISDNKWLSLSSSVITTLTAALLLIESEKYVLIVFAIVSFLYVLPFRQNIGLRWIPSLKIFIIAGSWTLLSSYATFETLTLPLYISIVAIFLFVIAISIPFDIRDLNIDSRNLSTIPQLIGIKKSIWLSQLLLTIAMTLFIFFAPEIYLKIIHGLFWIVAVILLNHLHKNQSQLYINFIIEGIPIIWLGMIGISLLF